MIRVWVPGRPKAQGSMQVVNRRTGKLRHKPELVQWRTAVAWRLKGYPTYDGPMDVQVVFFFKRPKSHTKAQREADGGWRDKTPDLDKLVRAILDAMTMAGVIHDDAQVVHLRAAKLYGPKEGVRINAYPLDPDDRPSWLRALEDANDPG